MATTKKVTQQQYDAALTSYNTATRSAQTLIQKRDAKISAINQEYAKSIQESEENAETAAETIKAYCIQNRDAVFGSAQSIKNWIGTIGFKKAPASVLLPEMDSAEILKMLHKKGLVALIRTKEELDKKAIKDIIEKGEDVKMVNKLASIGISVDTDKESFYIKLD